MEVFSAAAIAALVWKVISVIKMATGRDYKGVVTQALTWAAGIIAVVLAAQTDVAETVTAWGNMALSELDGWSQIWAGLVVASVGSAGYDFKKAFDNTDSAAEPGLGSGTSTGESAGM